MPGKIEEIVRLELASFEPSDPLRGLAISRRLSHVADMMDKIRWDARCVQAKGYDSADRQKMLPPNKRGCGISGSSGYNAGRRKICSAGFRAKAF